MVQEFSPLVLPEDINAVDQFGYTVLHEAVSHYGVDDVRRVIAAGAELNPRDPQGYTPLHIAAMNGKLDKIKVLLDAGAQVDPINELGDTPLAKVGLLARGAITLLRSYGADPYHRNASGKSILHYVRENIDNDNERREYADILDLPDEEREIPTEEEYQREVWGRRASGAVYQREYERILGRFMDGVTVQGVLAGNLNAVRDEAQGNGNINRTGSSDHYSEYVKFIEETLLADKGFDSDDRDEISADCGRIVQLEYPETDNEPYERLQDHIVEYIYRHPQPIPIPENNGETGEPGSSGQLIF